VNDNEDNEFKDKSKAKKDSESMEVANVPIIVNTQIQASREIESKEFMESLDENLEIKNIEKEKSTSSELSTEQPPESKTAILEAERRKMKIAASVIIVFVIMIVAAFMLQSSGYASERPGPVIDVKVKAKDSKAEQIDKVNGQYSFTTIEIRELRIGEALIAKMFGQELFTLSPASSSYDPSTQMLLSKQRAISTAFAISQGELPETAVAVTDVLMMSPASEAGIQIGDIIVAQKLYNGKEKIITNPQELTEIINDKMISLIIERRGKITENLVIEVTPRLEKIGVVVTTLARSSFNGLEILTDGVGGASAGLMFTMASLDHFSIGDLSGGKHISGSGTIEAAGMIGPVSGISLKAQAAAEAGASVFFVARSNMNEVGKYETMKVVPVDTVSDALTWLCVNGSVVSCKYVK